MFADPAELAALDALTHEAVAREVRRRLWQSEAPFAAIDAIGLFESGLAALCDETVCVLAPEETRIERLIRRDGISRERALARIRAQKSDEAPAGPVRPCPVGGRADAGGISTTM